MNDVDMFRLASTALIAAGAGFIGSGIGIAMATHRRPSHHSGWTSTVLSIVVGAVLIAFAIYRGAPWMGTGIGS